MKLLGWMHRKFRQNSSETFKDFAIGPSSLDDQQFYQKQNYGTKPIRQAYREYNARKSFAGLEDDFEDEESPTITEIFHGFLAIGTLGADPGITDPSTPTFSISVENITEKETEVTEDELKLINDELEKVLGAEAREEGCNDSSGRNSHVSMGRSSHGSTITLSGKPAEGAETNGNGTTICPLQGYLFGSAIELPETTMVAKKEHRTSLGELFQRTKMAEENSGAKCERGEKRTEKEGDKSAVHLVKKMLKKKVLHPSKSSTGAAGGIVDSALGETKLHKILHMFHRKVHPESSTSMQKPNKAHKNETKNNISHDVGYNNGDQILPEEDIMVFSQRDPSRANIRRFKSQSNPPQFILSNSDSNGNREHWIKTDADYLVLEL